MQKDHAANSTDRLADAFRDLESSINDIDLMSDILLLIRDDPTTGQLSRMNFAVTHIAGMIADLKLLYHGAFDEAAEKPEAKA